MTKEKMIFGATEWCALPELEIPAIKARIDSGATTSSLYAFNFQVIQESGQDYLLFDVYPLQRNQSVTKRCKAKLVGQRTVKSSNGHKEHRYVVETTMVIGEEAWPIEINLTNRDSMGYRMLIGRKAMENRALVDPASALNILDYSAKDIRSLYGLNKESKKKLRIAVLASNPKLYSNRRLIEAGEARGHEMIFVNVRQAYMSVNAHNGAIHYQKNIDITQVDAVIPRLRPSVTFYGCAITRQYQSMGVFCLNEASSIAISRDKLCALQVLATKGVNMPVTGFANSPENTKDLITMVGGAPLVIKLLEGTQGKGVILADTDKVAESMINSLKSLKANFLVQEFIKESAGTDVRCFVVDGKVVSAIERRATGDEFRANLHLGATASVTKITPQERKLAVTATKIMGLKVAGVDILRAKDGPKILEVNSSPGLEGVELYSGKDIAGAMIESIEKSLGFEQTKKAPKTTAQKKKAK